MLITMKNIQQHKRANRFYFDPVTREFSPEYSRYVMRSGTPFITNRFIGSVKCAASIVLDYENYCLLITDGDYIYVSFTSPKVYRPETFIRKGSFTSPGDVFDSLMRITLPETEVRIKSCFTRLFQHPNFNYQKVLNRTYDLQIGEAKGTITYLEGWKAKILCKGKQKIISGHRHPMVALTRLYKGYKNANQRNSTSFSSSSL